MSDITPLRRWLPLSDAVKQISERLGVPTEDARRALVNALRDDITRGEVRRRMTYMQRALEKNDVFRWARECLEFPAS